MAPPSRTSMASSRGPSTSTAAAAASIAQFQQQQLLPPTTSAASAQTDYSLELLTEYAHTLDAMPLDLSRIFADLRELDAVLTSTVASVTTKIYRLAEMIESSRRTKGPSTKPTSTDSTTSPEAPAPTPSHVQTETQVQPQPHAQAPTYSNEQRLWLLGEIAEEAGKIRPGTDDKIRIATQAADALIQQKQYLSQLAYHLPEFEAAMLVPKTKYPHVSPRAHLAAGHYHGHRDHGAYYGESSHRRRRVQNGAGLMGNGMESGSMAGGGAGASVANSPSKKRKLVQEEDQDYAAISSRSPRKDKSVGEQIAQSRSSRGPRTKKADRQASPPESIPSTTSHLPVSTNARGANGATRNNASGCGTGTLSSSKRRNNNPSHTGANPSGGQDSSLLESVLSRKDGHHNLAPSSSTSHPSLLDASEHANAGERFGHDADRKHGQRHGHGHGQYANSAGADGTSSSQTQRQALEGPGVSAAGTGALEAIKEGSPGLVPLSTSPSGTFTGTGSTAGTTAGGVSGTGTGTGASVDGTADVDMDIDGDDGKVYCFCETVSYGEMIGCDQEGCEREWFHLACIGLTEAPKGTWYCDDCVAKRNKQRNSRGGKKRSGGGGGGGGGRSSHRNNGS